eukprot:3125767-Heterocapsa_arctica.AAC.1
MLANRGIQVKVANTVRDLGIDATLGTRRSTPTSRARTGKSFRRMVKIKVLGKFNKKAAKLLQTGARPQATWGHQARGTPPSVLQTLRGKMAIAAGLKAGGCSSTALFLSCGLAGDPAYFLPIELISNWIMLWRTCPEVRVGIAKVWDTSLSDLTAAKGKWHKVRGPLAALQATLMDLGWQPKQVWQWIDPGGEEWSLDPSDGSLWQDLRQELIKTITAK